MVAAAVVAVAATVGIVAAVCAALVAVVREGPVVVGVSIRTCCGFHKVDKTVQDTDFTFELCAVDESFVGDLNEVEACKFESDDSDLN